MLLISLNFFLKAQNNLDASVSFATFQHQDGGYIEVYTHVLGQAVGLLPLTDSSGQAQLEVIILFKQGESVVKFDKYKLNGPVVKQPIDFVDAKRYMLSNGEYKLEVSIEDKVKPGNAKRYEAAVKMDYQPEGLAVSDIELVSSVKTPKPGAEASPMMKGNVLLEPMPINFYQKNDDLILFYYEVYNADKAIGEDYMHTFFIDNADSKERVEALFPSFKRKKAEAVTAAVQQIDITQLPSGNYNLMLEIRNKDKVLLASKVMPFQRSNPYLNLSQETIATGEVSLSDEFVGKLSADELVYALKAIFMHVDKEDGDHIKQITSAKNVTAMQLYLLSYWAKQNKANPGAAYEEYMQVARRVDEQFDNGFGYGFETDRGYIFLKYGPPNNTVFEENEPSAPPYEIWFYNQFPKTKQNNVKFLFYNPSLTTNGHVLLHSTARGERNNPRWEIDLYKNSPNEIENNEFIDGTSMMPNTGRQARRLFESF